MGDLLAFGAVAVKFLVDDLVEGVLRQQFALLRLVVLLALVDVVHRLAGLDILEEGRVLRQDEGEGGAANWFTASGDVELEDDSPMEFPEGKLSIKSTIGQVYKNEAAWEFFSKMTQGKIGPDMPMWGMIANFSFDMLMEMQGNVPENVMKALNKQLIAFDVVE